MRTSNRFQCVPEHAKPQVYLFTDVLARDSCKLVFSSYVNMLAHAVLLEASDVHQEHQELPSVSSFINQRAVSWADDPLFDHAFEMNLISFYNGKGRATQFCFNPEKDQLIYGNRQLYDIFANVIYRDPMLGIQPSGYVVFPSFSYDTVAWVQRNFMEYHRTQQPPDTYAGLVVIEADDENAFSHHVETLDGILDHVDLLRAFFDPTHGHPLHRVVFSTVRIPFVLPKAFDLGIYNEFREIYNELCEDPSAYDSYSPTNIYVTFCKELAGCDARPRPVPAKLEWVRRYLHKGSVFIWHDCTPYRFRCFRGPSASALFCASRDPAPEQGAPLVCVELTYLPLRDQSPAQIKGDAVAFATGTVSPNPIRYTSFIKKFGNRFEKQVVRLMTADKLYDSPFAVRGDYWRSVTNPLLFALKGIDNDHTPFLWTDFV
jgi:hypothetical protein